MSRLSLSRQPTAYIGLLAAILVVLTTVGVDVPDGLQAAIGALIVALGTVLTWSQVRPVKHSYSPQETRAIADKAVETYAAASKTADVEAAATPTKARAVRKAPKKR